MNRWRWLTRRCRGSSVALCWRWYGRCSERAHGGWCYRWRCFRSTRSFSLSPSFDATGRAFFEAQRCRFEKDLMPGNDMSVTHIIDEKLVDLVRVLPH